MSRRFDVAMANQFGLASRLGQPVEERHVRQFGAVRSWKPIRDDGILNSDELVAPLAARKPWVWRLVGCDPWKLERGMADLIVAVAASSGACYGKSLFLMETEQETAFWAWKHSLMAEGTNAIITYLADPDYQRSSAARAALPIPMRDPEPPTGEVRALYDRAMRQAERLAIVWPLPRCHGLIPQCHWQKWPIQHVLIAGVGHGWSR